MYLYQLQALLSLGLYRVVLDVQNNIKQSIGKHKPLSLPAILVFIHLKRKKDIYN